MKQLESDRTGRIIKQPGGYNAFIPHLLNPDGPKIDIDHECMILVSEAERALGELKGIGELLPNPDLFIAFYVKKEALLSSQIEGTQCSLDEVVQVDETAHTMKPVDEVVNYIKAMNYGLNELRRLPMSLRLINNIHQTLMEGVRGMERRPGEFKTGQNWIGPSGATLREATYVPPPPYMMLELMGDFEKYYHAESNLPPLIKTAILHSSFETIHPYADGNGRLGRLLITFALCEKKILDRPLLYLSLFFKQNRPQYYEALTDVRFEGSWEAWIKFFLRGVRNTSNEASNTAREILDLQRQHRQIVGETMRKHKIALASYDLICRKPIITITEISKTFEVGYPAAKVIVDGFCSKGILSPYGERKRNKHYRYSPYLDILSRGT